MKTSYIFQLEKASSVGKPQHSMKYLNLLTRPHWRNTRSLHGYTRGLDQLRFDNLDSRAIFNTIISALVERLLVNTGMSFLHRASYLCHHASHRAAMCLAMILYGLPNLINGSDASHLNLPCECSL